MTRAEKVAPPLTFEEISCEWLTHALSQRYPGVEVTSFTFDSGMHTTSSKARLRLQYNDAGQRAGLPPQMYIKGGFDPRVLKRIWGGLAIEVRFFTEIAPELKINIPKCYYAEFDDKSRQGIVLLEDLTERGATFGAPNRPITPDRVAAMLELMGEYHGRWWNDPRLGKYTAQKEPLRVFMKWQLRRSWWNQVMDMPAAAYMPAGMRDGDLVERAVDRLWELNDSQPQTYAHADLHLGNTFYEADSAPGILDWQCSMPGRWGHDVSYFMTCALSIEDRRANERELLRHYLGALGTYCDQAPSFDEAWLEHRRQMMHGLAVAVPTPHEQMPEANTILYSYRFSQAAEDLDVLDALGIKRSN